MQIYIYIDQLQKSFYHDYISKRDDSSQIDAEQLARNTSIFFLSCHGSSHLENKRAMWKLIGTLALMSSTYDDLQKGQNGFEDVDLQMFCTIKGRFKNSSSGINLKELLHAFCKFYCPKKETYEGLYKKWVQIIVHKEQEQ